MIVEKWRSRFLPSSEEDLRIEPLTPELVDHVRLGWRSQFSPNSLRAHVAAYPELAWCARTNRREIRDYIVGDYWRRRLGEIGYIVESGGHRHQLVLFQKLMRNFSVAGCCLVMLANEEFPESSKFYADQGFSSLEQIIYYERLNLDVEYQPSRLEIRPLVAADVDRLVELDHDAFPWLWWNSREESRHYSQMEEVQIYVAERRGKPIGYLGFTIFERWGHLDRLAVIASEQGKGYGAEQLNFAISRMGKLGVKRLTLSTQETNSRSQRLYESFGFRRTGEKNRLYGCWLVKPREGGR